MEVGELCVEGGKICEEVTVQSEISTWQVQLAVTFGALYEEKFGGIMNTI